MRNDHLEEVFDAWVADRKLSRRKLAFLEEAHSQTMEAVENGYSLCPDLAGSQLCSELEMPAGSFVCQLVAELLDYLRPLDQPPSRLVLLNKELVELGLLEEEPEG